MDYNSIDLKNLHLLDISKIKLHKLLPFKKKKKQDILKLSHIYLHLAELNPIQLQAYKKYILARKNYIKVLHIFAKDQFLFYKDTMTLDELKDYNFDNYSLNIYKYYPNFLFIRKLANYFMIHGNRRVAYRIILKAFELLKLHFNISNPVKLLMYLIFLNLVPVMRTKTIGFRNKKILGVKVSISRRITTSIKLFVKGVRAQHMPVSYGIITELLNILKKKSTLQLYNSNLYKEIITNRLHRFFKIDYNDILPEKRLFKEELHKQKYNIFILKNFNKIDFINFKLIVRDLTILNFIKRMKLQSCILNELKRYIMLTENITEYDLSDLYGLDVVIYLNDFKFSKHKMYKKITKNYTYDLNSCKNLIIDRNTILNEAILDFLRSKRMYKMTYANRNLIKNFHKINKYNPFFIPVFKRILFDRLEKHDKKLKERITDDMIVTLYKDYNPTNIDLKLKPEYFPEIFRIKEVYYKYNIWDNFENTKNVI